MTTTNWVEPGHELPPEGTYKDLEAWITHSGHVYVGTRAVHVVPLDAVLKALRERGEYACCGFEQEAAEFLQEEFGEGTW